MKDKTYSWSSDNYDRNDRSFQSVLSSENILQPMTLLMLTSFPPRECGIATYSQDLIKSLKNKFSQSFDIEICAIESNTEQHIYSSEVTHILNTDQPEHFTQLAAEINSNEHIQTVMLQHEFGFFSGIENEFVEFLNALNKKLIITFHTVLPNPDETLKQRVIKLASTCENIIVMTQASYHILISDYKIESSKIAVIPHGTHLVQHDDKRFLKKKFGLHGKKVLSTFGLLGSGKSIETTLKALPHIIATHEDVVFLIIGKTHPSIVKREGEAYREYLHNMVVELGLERHVQFVNHFLNLPDLLQYLQLTDIYLFTSKDRNQAVSGTFSYAISCGCPIISTPIPHAREVLGSDCGIIVPFEDSILLAEAVNQLLDNDTLRNNIRSNGLHRIASTAWENSALSHAKLIIEPELKLADLEYNLPELNFKHFYNMTTEFGMIQFAKLNKADVLSGYTLDDNARALIVVCGHYELTGDIQDLEYIRMYLNFIEYCQKPDGSFFNYVDVNREFTAQNFETNLADSTGRACWALGYVASMSELLPKNISAQATNVFNAAMSHLHNFHSPRAMAFIIKGLFYKYKNGDYQDIHLVEKLAHRLAQMYRHESSTAWHWYESYLTYANSILPEAMLCAWLITDNVEYREMAKTSFDFLLKSIFDEKGISVVTNISWLHRNDIATPAGGEQPIDVAYTIIALDKFYTVFHNESYKEKMTLAFNWFLGLNHLNQIIYNPCTGGCFDGLEEEHVNLNQGAESTVCYLMARLTMERYIRKNSPKYFAPKMIEWEDPESLRLLN